MSNVNLIILALLFFAIFGIKTRIGKVLFILGALLEAVSVYLLKIINNGIDSSMFDKLTIQVKMLSISMMGEYLIIASAALLLCAGWKNGPEHLASFKRANISGVLSGAVLGYCIMVIITFTVGLAYFLLGKSFFMGLAIGIHVGFISGIIALICGAYNEARRRAS